MLLLLVADLGSDMNIKSIYISSTFHTNFQLLEEESFHTINDCCQSARTTEDEKIIAQTVEIMQGKRSFDCLNQRCSQSCNIHSSHVNYMLNILNSFGAVLVYFLRGACMGFGGGAGTNPSIGGGVGDDANEACFGAFTADILSETWLADDVGAGDNVDAGTNIVLLETHCNTHACFIANGGVDPENGVVVHSNSDKRTHFGHARVDAWAGTYRVDAGFVGGDNVGAKDGADARADAANGGIGREDGLDARAGAGSYGAACEDVEPGDGVNVHTSFGSYREDFDTHTPFRHVRISSSAAECGSGSGFADGDDAFGIYARIYIRNGGICSEVFVGILADNGTSTHIGFEVSTVVDFVAVAVAYIVVHMDIDVGTYIYIDSDIVNVACIAADNRAYADSDTDARTGAEAGAYIGDDAATDTYFAYGSQCEKHA
uniref:Uncharacterized protein n=1 Tax=Glossina pallidipes TaxID=7398 RepID=A0A1A9ZAH3_GLOPL